MPVVSVLSPDVSSRGEVASSKNARIAWYLYSNTYNLGLHRSRLRKGYLKMAFYEAEPNDNPKLEAFLSGSVESPY